MTALYWVVTLLMAGFAIVCWQLADRNLKALEASRRLAKVLAEGLRQAHERHATDNDIYHKREQALRALMIRVASLLEVALAARDYGEDRVKWEKAWSHIEEAQSLAMVFPSRD